LINRKEEGRGKLPNSINGCSLVFLKLPNCRSFRLGEPRASSIWH